MKFNIVKKAFAVVLAAALVTTGMPVEMAGAGVVKAADHPLDSTTTTNLEASNVTSEMKVADLTYPSYVKAEDITVVIKKNNIVQYEGSLSNLSRHISDYELLMDKIGDLSNSVGTHKESVTITGINALSGTKTIDLNYVIAKAKAYVEAAVSSSGDLAAGSTGRITSTIKYNDNTGNNINKPEISYSVTQGDGVVELQGTKGVFKCLKSGSATIRVTVSGGADYDGAYYDVPISVQTGSGISGFKVENSTIELKKGNTETIKVKNAKGTNVTYGYGSTGSLAESVGHAELVNGGPLVRAVNPGQEDLWAYDPGNDDYAAAYAPVTVNVYEYDNDFTISGSSLSVGVNESKSMNFETSSKGNITFDYSDPTVATATYEGTKINVTGLSAGTTTVVAKQAASQTDGADDYKYPGAERVFEVTVEGKANSFTLDDSATTVGIGKTVRVGYKNAVGSPITVKETAETKAFASVSTETGASSGEGYLVIQGIKVGTFDIVVTDPGDGITAKSEKTLKVTVEGTESSFTINPEKVDPLVVNEKTTALYIGAAGTVTATPVSGTSGSVSALVNNGKIEITGLTAGDAAVAVKDSGSDTVAASEKTIAVTVVQRDSEFKLTETKADIKANGTANIGFTGNKGTVTASIKSGNGVVKLDGTKVTGLKEGTAVITVTDPGNAEYKGASADFTVKVTKNASSFALNATSAKVTYGGKYTIGWKNAAGTVSITSGNAAVATANAKGVVTIKKPGTASFTVKDAGSDKVAGSTKTFKLTVSKATPSVTIGFKSGSTKVGGTAVYQITGNKTSAPTVTTGNKKVATISSKSKTQIKVKCVAAGTSKITVKVPGNAYYNAMTKTFNVKVTAASQTLKVTPASVSLEKAGKTKQLKVTGAKTTLTYKSSNTKVATVSKKGKVTAKGKGSCKITVTAAKTANYAKATKTVKVTVKN